MNDLAIEKGCKINFKDYKPLFVLTFYFYIKLNFKNEIKLDYITDLLAY